MKGKQRNLQVIRRNIRQGERYLAMIYPGKEASELPAQSVTPVHRVVHRKVKSEVVTGHSPILMLPTRTLTFIRGKNAVIKTYLVPNKPMLFPFAERRGGTLPLSYLRSRPYSLVTSPGETQGSRPATSTHGGGLISALRRSLSMSYLNASKNYFFFLGLGAGRISACFLCRRSRSAFLSYSLS